MNTLGSWAIDRSYGAGRPLWSGRRVRMVKSPLSSLTIRVALDTLDCLKLLACPDRSLSRILPRNKPNSDFEGGDRPKLTHFTL